MQLLTQPVGGMNFIRSICQRIRTPRGGKSLIFPNFTVWKKNLTFKERLCWGKKAQRANIYKVLS